MRVHRLHNRDTSLELSRYKSAIASVKTTSRLEEGYSLIANYAATFDL